MANRSKHAFGMLENIDQALSNGTIDAYDILFMKDENGKPYIGWVDKDGNKVIYKSDEVDLSGIESEIENIKSNLEINIGEVDAKIAAAMDEHLTSRYEITDVPDGALVKISDSEIRIMCKQDSEWKLQNVGAGGDSTCYYCTFKTYVPNDNVVGYIERMGTQVDSEILNTFSTDEHGRRYQVTWLALAKHNEETDTWSYYGANSTVNKYIGWDYQIDWYDANGVVIASDSVRINLSNEDCHYAIEPYYVGSIMKNINTIIDEKIAESESVYEVVEF